MLTIAPPDLQEARSNATFEALMWTLARPGEIRDMAGPGFSLVIEALIDLECTVYAGNEAVRHELASTGAEVTADIGSADHVFADTAEDALALLPSLGCGTALYPDDGATLVVEAAIGQGQRLRLSGPGIDGVRELALALPAAFWSGREARCLYPEGFDIFVVDGARVVGIPRSSTVEVL